MTMPTIPLALIPDITDFLSDEELIALNSTISKERLIKLYGNIVNLYYSGLSPSALEKFVFTHPHPGLPQGPLPLFHRASRFQAKGPSTTIAYGLHIGNPSDFIECLLRNMDSKIPPPFNPLTAALSIAEHHIYLTNTERSQHFSQIAQRLLLSHAIPALSSLSQGLGILKKMRHLKFPIPNELQIKVCLYAARLGLFTLSGLLTRGVDPETPLPLALIAQNKDSCLLEKIKQKKCSSTDFEHLLSLEKEGNDLYTAILLALIENNFFEGAYALIKKDPETPDFLIEEFLKSCGTAQENKYALALLGITPHEPVHIYSRFVLVFLNSLPKEDVTPDLFLHFAPDINYHYSDFIKLTKTWELSWIEDVASELKTKNPVFSQLLYQVCAARYLKKGKKEKDIPFCIRALSLDPAPNKDKKFIELINYFSSLPDRPSTQALTPLMLSIPKDSDSRPLAESMLELLQGEELP